MRLPLQLGLAVVVLASATNVQAQMRFRGMDRNNDGVITRAEWRGNDQSFRNQDWNRDGVLNNQDIQIAQRFRGYDMNNDNRVAAHEWPGDQRLFTRLDTNRDSHLTMQEYRNGAGFRLDSLGGPSYGFSGIDHNGDGWVTRNEWNMGSADFNRLDLNRDNRISRFEYDTPSAAGNDDQSSTRRSAAWRTGHDRGIAEGRAAGREDFVRNHGWDLEGQRELVGADSGYTPQVGSLSEYQAGYREGFRNAYRTGFYEARDKR